jgi:transposase
MAMGKRKRKHRQQSMWIATQDLPRSAAHPFYARLNRILEQSRFDDYVEEQCSPFYAPTMGRPSLAPGRYFRLLMLGYFEEIESERGIAWRAADSLSVRAFLGLELEEAPPDHSTISRTRRLIDLETHRAVFTWILERISQAGLVNGKTVGVDATTLEANAALRSIVRRDNGETYEAFLMRLAQASGDRNANPRRSRPLGPQTAEQRVE